MDFTLPDWIPFAVTAVVILGFIWWKFREDILLRSKGKVTTGRITNWMSASEKGVRYYYPMIEFTTEEGQRIQFRAEERCEGQPMYPQGQEVQIRYLPGNPRKNKVTYPAATAY